MSRGEQETPLLADQEGGLGQSREQHSFGNDEGRIEVFVRNTIKQRSALSVQIFAIAFVALIWGLVFSNMPLKPLPLFGYHPIIQSFTFLLLIQAILTLQPTSLNDPTEKQKAFSVHRIINLALILPLFTIGASIMWYLHDQPGTKHFISWHGILGTSVIVLVWIQIFVGILLTSFYTLIGGQETAKKFYKWHRISGYTILLLFLFVLFLGATQTSWSQSNASSTHQITTSFTLIGILLTLFTKIQWSKLPKFNSSS